jgi:DNA-binding FadR family transcriptional regulator
MQQAFPGKAPPASVVVKAPNVNAPVVRTAIHRFERQALASGRVHEPITVDVNKDATVANISVPIDGTGTDSASHASLAALRNAIAPETVGALRADRLDGCYFRRLSRALQLRFRKLWRSKVARRARKLVRRSWCVLAG